MKRACFGLYLVTLGACTVSTPIAEETPAAEEQLSAEEQLRASIEPFCADFCALLTGCGAEPHGEPCLEDCHEYMGVFVDHGDECVGYGREVQLCFAPLDTCEKLDDPPACAKNDDGYDLCKQADSSGPPVGAVLCDVSESADQPVATTNGDLPATCEMQIDSCSDGSTYRVLCQSFGDKLACSCLKDGEAVRSFVPEGTCPPSLELVNAQCGWAIIG